MRETDWVLPPKLLRHYLSWLREHFEEGLDESRIDQIVGSLAQLTDCSEILHSFTVVHEGRAFNFKVGLSVFGDSEIAVKLCSEPDLSESLDWTIERFYDDMTV